MAICRKRSAIRKRGFRSPRWQTRTRMFLLCVPWLVVACKKDAPAAPVDLPVSVKVEPQSPPSAPSPAETPEADSFASSVSDVLRVNFATATKAYAKNCAWQRMVPSDMEGEPETTACEYLSFDQSCEEPSTCGKESEQCKAACVKGCTSCDTLCTPSCNSCKKTCGKDAACLEQCATERTSCHAQCISQKAKCEGQCEGTYETCEKTFAERVKKTCPDCGAIGECSQLEQREACEKPFRKKNPAECFEWCYQQ
jgi:hypothetical protein